MSTNDLLNRLWAAGDLDAAFGQSAKVVAPWPRAGGVRNQPRPHQLPTAAIQSPVWLTEVDPRDLWASQTWVLRQHAEFYRTGWWEVTGLTSADRDVESNHWPIIKRDRLGRNVIAAGHHRALAALIEGRPLLARVFPAQHGGAIALTPTVLFGSSATIDHVRCSSQQEAVAAVWAGRRALCPTLEIASAAVLAAAPSFDRRRFPGPPTLGNGVLALGWHNRKAVDVTGLLQMCTTCAGLKAERCPLVGGRHDHCRCDAVPSGETGIEREHALRCQLCEVCGIQIAAGHSKYRFVLCNDCLDVASEFNERIGHNVVLPGIHSLVNQSTLLAEHAVHDPEAVERFAQQLNHMFGQVAWLSDWSTSELLRRLRDFGFGPGQTIPLDDYLRACDRYGISMDHGWRRLELLLMEIDGASSVKA